MKTAVTISPVNMDGRKNLGIWAGDNVRVWQKIQEKGKTRRQAFEGLVLARKHGSEAGATFTVRRVASGVGVEKIFPLYSPQIDQIEILRRATKVRRAKLYYIRDKAARDVRRQMRSMIIMPVAKKTAGAESGEEQTEVADTQEDSAAAEE